MHIELPYGEHDKQVAELPDSWQVDFVYPNEVPTRDELSVLQEALAHPIDAPPIHEFLNTDKLLFVVNDHTRPTPSAKVLELLKPHLANKELHFLIATGIHRRSNPTELRRILGDFYEVSQDRIYFNDSENKSNYRFMGTTSRGTPVWVHKCLFEFPRVVVITSVEPHYFAGFTGGRKSILPGITAYETIEANHKLALLPDSHALKLDGNPVAEDMHEGAHMVLQHAPPMFFIQLVLDRHHRIYAAFTGDMDASFLKAVTTAHEIFVTPIDAKADMVITVAPFPMDVDLYQSQKAIDNAKLALTPNGILLLVSKCREGIGEQVFYELLSQEPTPQAVLNRIAKGYKLGYHKAAKLAEIATWAHMWAVTDLPPNVLNRIFIRPFDTLQSAIDTAYSMKGDNLRVLIMPEGSITIPYLEPSE